MLLLAVWLITDRLTFGDLVSKLLVEEIIQTAGIATPAAAAAAALACRMCWCWVVPPRVLETSSFHQGQRGAGGAGIGVVW
jgi:hypothetical protein